MLGRPRSDCPSASTTVEPLPRDGVATVTIDRPDVQNAFCEQTMRELIDAFDADPDAGFYGTSEFHEGTTAFLDRRAPRFR